MIARLIVTTAMCLLFAGCGGVFNPYRSEFDCPMGDKGKCISVPNAHKEALGANSNNDDHNGKGNGNGNEKSKKSNGSNGVIDEMSPRDVYQQEMAKKLVGYIKQPNTPFITPPTVMRALILPYRASAKELYSERFIYFIADDPQWVVSAPTYSAESTDMILEKPNIQTKK